MLNFEQAKTLMHRSLATARFEFRRMFTVQRMGVFAVLSLFPPVIVLFVCWGSNIAGDPIPSAPLIFIILFLVAIVCGLSLLLWASTNVYSELEGKSWGYVASRPDGRLSILFGKYIVAVLQSFAICQIALLLTIALGSRFGQIRDPIHIYLTLSGVFLLSCVAYSAIMSLIGVIFYRRAMVVAASYFVAVEFFIANIPALIGKLTVRQHTQDLAIHWLEKDLPVDPANFAQLFSDYPDWLNFLAITLITLAALGLGAYLIKSREYLIGDET